jgi:hypothetical protein
MGLGRRSTSTTRWTWLVLATVGLIGCSGSDSGPELHSVSGVATRNGKPLPKLFVSLRPDDKMHASEAFGATDAEGRFTLAVGSREGAFPGSHTVFVGDPAAIQGGQSSTDPDYRAAIEKYGKNSPLKITIDKDMDNWELKLD